MLGFQEKFFRGPLTKTKQPVFNVNQLFMLNNNIVVAKLPSITDSTDAMKILRGCFERLPDLKPNIFKVYLSSTVTDFELERRYIFENIYEKLRSFCVNNYQIDFVLVDMRWGLVDDEVDLNLIKKNCFDQIKECQDESIGASFVAFLGHRYGKRFMKPMLDDYEFDSLKMEIGKLKHKDIENLFELCYVIDENDMTERKYRLRTQEDIMTTLGYNVKHDIKKWKEVEQSLIDAMQNAAESLYYYKEFSERQRNSYFLSVVQQEIFRGILAHERETVQHMSLAFFRNIPDLWQQTTHDVAPFRDDYNNAQFFLEKLKKRTERRLGSDNKHIMNIGWLESNGLDKTNEVTIKYLEDFGKQFYDSVRKLIENGVVNMSQETDELAKLCDIEVLQHAAFCNRLNSNVVQRHRYIEKVKKYMLDYNNNRPYIICGASGSGKSTLLSTFVTNKISQDDIVITRFIGITYNSSTIKYIFTSILDQLNKIFDRSNRNEIRQLDDMTEIRDCFLKNLKQISDEYSDQRIIILIDSIDKLSSRDLRLEWMLYELPHNCKLILTINSQRDDTILRLQKKLGLRSTNLISIDSLQFPEAKQILTNWLTKANRKLSEEQWGYIDDSLKSTILIYPLQLKFIYDICVKWTSWYKPDDSIITCTTIKDTIKYLFNNLEKQFGKIIISRIIFYVTFFDYVGISETELMDVLSIDDVVLTSVFERYDAEPLSIRCFPSALWFRIKYELKDYLVARESDGIPVIVWSHRAFIDVAKELYQDNFKPSKVKDAIIVNILDYFTEEWNDTKSDNTHGMRKSFQHTKPKLIEKYGENCSSYRYTRSQIMEFEYTRGCLDDEGAKLNGYNMRKLNRLLFIILQLNDYDYKVECLKKLIYFNYEFMYTKARLRDMNFVVDMHSAIESLHLHFERKKSLDNALVNPVDELIAISVIYRDKYHFIHKYPDSLAHQVLSRLTHKSPLIDNYKMDSLKYCGLMVSRNYQIDEDIVEIYKLQKGVYTQCIHWSPNSSYIFVQSEGGHKIWFSQFDQNDKTRLHFLNHQNSKFIGDLELEKNLKNIRILLNQDSHKSCSKLTDFDGQILFTNNSNALYAMSFEENLLTIRSFNQKIDEILVLSMRSVLVCFETTFQIVNIQPAIDTETDHPIHNDIIIDENAFIEFIYATIPTHFAHTTDFDNMDHVFIIVALASNKLKVYDFSKKLQQLSLMATIDLIDIAELSKHMNMFYIDEVFSIEYIMAKKLFDFEANNSDIVLRFAVSDNQKFCVTCVNVYRDGRYECEWLHEDTFKILNSVNNANKFDILSFFDNKIVLKIPIGRHSVDLFVYDFGKKKYIQKRFYTDHLYVLDENQLIIEQYHDRLYFYNIRETEIIKISKVQLVYLRNLNETKYDFKVVDNKLLWRKPDGSAVIRIDYLSEKLRLGKAAGLDVARIYDAIDSNHIIVELDKRYSARIRDLKLMFELPHFIIVIRDYKFEIAIVNVVNQTIIDTLYVNKNISRIEAINFKNGYLVLLDPTDECVYIYCVRPRDNKLRFHQITTLKYNQDNAITISDPTVQNPIKTDAEYLQSTWATTLKCFFNDEANPHKFLFSICDLDKRHLRLYSFEYFEEKNYFECSHLQHIDLRSSRQIDLDFNRYEVNFTLTSTDKYLVVYQKYNKLVHFIDLKTKVMQYKYEVSDGRIIDLLPVRHNSNDVLISIGKLTTGLFHTKAIIYVGITDSNEFKIIRKDYQDKIAFFEIIKNYLIVVCDEYFDFINLNNDNMFDEGNYTRYNVSMMNFCITSDLKFLMFRTKSNELCLIRLRDMIEMTRLPLLKHFNSLVASEKYLSIRIDSRLLSFLIVDHSQKKRVKIEIETDSIASNTTSTATTARDL